MPGPWEPPVWGDTLPLKADNSQASTSITAGVVGHGSHLYCVWVEKDTQKLLFSIFSNGVWESIKPVSLVDSDPERACDSPSLAVLNGVIHAVYPNENRNLIHIQLDPTTKVWSHRYGLGFRCTSAPCTTDFQGKLFCVFREDSAGQKYPKGALRMTEWSDMAGWKPASKISGVKSSTGQVAIFELMACLQMLVVDDETKKIKRYIYKNANAAWDFNDIKGTSQSPDAGLTVQCVNNIAFMACYSQGAAMVSQFNTEKWIVSRQVAPSTRSTPAIAVLTNRLMCFWNNKVTEALQWKARNARKLPQLDRWMSALG